MLLFKVVCVLALILGHNADIVAAGPPHFQQWFRQFSSDLETTLQDACSTEFQHYYLNEVGLDANIENPLGCHANSINPLGCLASAVVDCMLANTKESTKANFASAAVLLGIMPTTLGLVGSNTVETALLALRRPLLALLLASGAPTVSPLRTFDYGHPQKVLSKSFRHRRFPNLKSSPRFAAIAFLEYVFAGIAVANLAHVCWQLSNLAVCGFSPETAYLPLLWAFLALIIHISGAITNRFRISLKPIKGTAFELCMREFQLNARLPPTTLEFKQESYNFIFFSWLTSTGSVLHIMFGTLVFSSLLFISTRDAAFVVLRFVLSAVICRAVLMLELSGMRECVVVEKHVDELAELTNNGVIVTG